MGPNKPIAMAFKHEVAQDDLVAWSRQVAQAMDTGERLVTLLGRTDSEMDTHGAVITTAVLQREDGHLTVLRGRGPCGGAYPSLTPRHPAAQMFERELWEQLGITPTGHPWLKPVRYEGLRQQLYDRCTGIVGQLTTRSLNGFPGFPVTKLNEPRVRDEIAAFLGEIRQIASTAE